MKPMQNIRRQIHAKKNIFGAIILSTLLTMVTLTSFITLVPISVSAGYSEFDHSMKGTIESDYIESTLPYFPALIMFTSNASLSNNVNEGDGGDIIFYSYDNNTIYPHEIEYWNADGTLVAWVNITSVSSTTDTRFWIYYGSATQTENEDVDGTWHTNFDLVCHMNNTGTAGRLYDSSNNHYSMYKESAGTPVEKDGNISKWQNFNTSYVYLGDNNALNFTENDTMSVECWYKMHVKPAGGSSVDPYLYAKGHDFGGADDSGYRLKFDTSDDIKAYMAHEGVKWIYAETLGSDWINLTHYVTANDGLFTTSSLKFYSNGTRQTLGVSGAQGTTRTSGRAFDIGTWDHENNGNNRFNGFIDEFRVYNIQINNSWINASFHTQNQTTGFLSWGLPTGGATTSSSYSIEGITSDRVTWTGNYDTVVWSNSTGNNEVMKIHCNVTGSDNVSDIRIRLGNQNNSGQTSWINGTNVSLYVSSTGSNYGLIGSFTDSNAGTNLSINTTTWAGGSPDPFPIDPAAGWENATIYCIYRLNIPATASLGYYYQHTTWNVYIGNYA